MSGPTNWRDRIKVHPAADMFPMMSDDELDELAADIAKNGLRQPIVLWNKSGKITQDAANITVVPDGNGDFTKGMGMLVDKRDLGFGMRSWRYSMLVRDGIIEKMFT